MASTDAIVLPSLAVLDAIEAAFDAQKAAAMGRHSAGQAAAVNAALTQIKAGVMGQLRARCVTLEAPPEPVDIALAARVIELQDELTKKAAEVAALRAKYRDQLPAVVSGRLRKRMDSLSAPTAADDDLSASSSAAASSGGKGSARKRRRTGAGAGSSSAEAATTEEDAEREEQLRGNLEMLQGVTDDISKAIAESGPSVARAVRDAQDTAEVVRMVSKGPSALDKVLASTASVGGGDAGAGGKGRGGRGGRR